MLQFSNIKKAFSGVEVLHGVSFSVNAAAVTALVGENGAGKSTLMKILSGVLVDYEGDILIDGQKRVFKNPVQAETAGISIIHQELNLIPDLTVAENIFLGKEPVGKFGLVKFKELHRKADELLKEFEFPFSSHLKVKDLGVGWQQIVEIARVFAGDAQIIIMDEPTSALSEHEIAILFDKIKLLKKNGKAVIFISHRLEEIFEVSDAVAILRDGKFIAKYPAVDISTEQLISEMTGKKYYEAAGRKSAAASDVILSVDNLSINVQNKAVLSNISFSLKKGEILGLAGLLGSGKTELLMYLFGLLKERSSGEIAYDGENYIPDSPAKAIAKKIFYITKHRKTEGIFAEKDLILNTTISNLQEYTKTGFVQSKSEIEAVSVQLNELKVKRASLRQSIKTLSGGNQQKVLLGRALLLKPRLLLLDEPTRGIDVGAKSEIYKLLDRLSNEGITVLMSSAEIPELLRVCDSILVLANGRETAFLKANETNAEEVLHYAFNQEEV